MGCRFLAERQRSVRLIQSLQAVSASLLSSSRRRLLLLLAGCLCLSYQAATGSDQQPSVDELHDLALLLWEEGSRLSLAGAYLPRELPGVVSLVTALPANASPERRAALADLLEGYAEEISRKGTEADPFGQLLARTPGRLTAGSRALLRQDYRVAAAVRPGGGFLVTSHWTHEVNLQALLPGEPNYVGVEAPPGVSFSTRPEMKGGIHGGYDQAEKQLFFEVIEGELQPGDQVTFTYAQLELPSIATDTFTLPVYVRLTPSGHLYSVRPPEFRVLGSQPARVLARIPSVLQRNERFTLKLTALDEFGNLSGGRVPDLEVVHNNRLFTRALSFQGEMDVDSLVFAESGPARLQLRSGGGSLWGETNPARIADDPVYELIWADLQQRTALSDGQGSVAAHLRLAERDGLSILGIAEKDAWVNAADWQSLLSSSSSDELLLLPGLTFARPASQGGGQVSLLTRALPGPGLEEIGRQGRSGPGSWLRAMLSSGLGDAWYHLAVPYPDTDLRSLLAPALSGVQLFGNEGAAPWLADAIADRGYQAAVLGTAGRIQGLNLATEGVSAFWRSRQENLLDTLKSGRNYATSGARILLDLRINGRLLSARVPQAAERRIEGRVSGESPIRTILLWKNGRIHEQLDYVYPGSDPASVIATNGELTRAVLELNWFAGPSTANAWNLRLDLSPGSVSSPLGGGLRYMETPAGALLRLDSSGRRMSSYLPLTGLHLDTIVNLELAGQSELVRIPLVQLLRGEVKRTLGRGVRHELTLRLHPGMPSQPLSSLPGSRHFQFVDSTSGTTEDLYLLEVYQTDDQVARTRVIRVGGHTID